MWAVFIRLQLRDSVNSITNIWVSQSGGFFNLRENSKFLKKVYAPRSHLRIYKERNVGLKEAQHFYECISWFYTHYWNCFHWFKIQFHCGRVTASKILNHSNTWIVVTNRAWSMLMGRIDLCSAVLCKERGLAINRSLVQGVYKDSVRNSIWNEIGQRT
jgi:hypothetical protein